jgi:hypothetical protein
MRDPSSSWPITISYEKKKKDGQISEMESV